MERRKEEEWSVGSCSSWYGKKVEVENDRRVEKRERERERKRKKRGELSREGERRVDSVK